MSTAAPADEPASFQPTDAQNPRRAGGLSPGVAFGVTLLGVALLAILIWVTASGSHTADFLAKMHASPYGTHGSTDAELVQMGHNVCGAFDRGRTVKEIAFSFWGMTEQQRGYLMGAAVSTICTEHRDALIGEFNAYNGY